MSLGEPNPIEGLFGLERQKVLATALISLISQEVLTHEDVDIVTDRHGRVIQRGIEVPVPEDPTMRRSIDLYNERSPDEPVIEIVSAYHAEGGWGAVKMNIFQSGRITENVGNTKGPSDEITWLSLAKKDDLAGIDEFGGMNYVAAWMLDNLTECFAARHGSNN